MTYQDIPRADIPFHRGFSEYRAKRILEVVDPIHIEDRLLLDLGCNVGSISDALSGAGAIVTGVDYDEEAIELAKKHAKNKTITFEVQDITLEYIQGLPQYDVIVWLSQFMWLVKQKGLEYALDCLWELSRKCEVLVFETAGMDGSAPLGIPQEQVIQLLLKNTVFQDIRDTGPWAGGMNMDMGWPPRNVFVCSKPFLGSETELSKVELLKRGEVKKTYKVGEGLVGGEILEREVKFLRKFNLPVTSVLWGDMKEYFPKLLESDSTSFTMSYVGPRAKFIPEKDVQKILSFLREHSYEHRDIRPENLLWNGHNVVLCDFAWMIWAKETTNYSHDVGGAYKSPYGFDDEYSLRKVQKELL